MQKYNNLSHQAGSTIVSCMYKSEQSARLALLRYSEPQSNMIVQYAKTIQKGWLAFLPSVAQDNNVSNLYVQIDRQGLVGMTPKPNPR